MNGENRTVINRALMELIIDNYRKIEEKYQGYTSKREAAALINYCYHRGWTDLSKRSMSIFGMDILEIVPDRLFLKIKNDELRTMVNSVHDMV